MAGQKAKLNDEIVELQEKLSGRAPPVPEAAPAADPVQVLQQPSAAGAAAGRLRVVPGVLNAAAPEPADGSDDDVDDAIGSAAGPGGSAAADDAAADDGADEAAVDEDREPLPPGDDHGTAKCCPAQLAAWKSLRAKIKRDPQHILLQSEFPPEPAASAGKVIPIFFLWARSLFMLHSTSIINYVLRHIPGDRRERERARHVLASHRATRLGADGKPHPMLHYGNFYSTPCKQCVLKSIPVVHQVPVSRLAPGQ